ncbi:MAG TPA: hypothetical protein VKA61_00535, partial [Sphingomicrobium sp.]|nr:hypothetical protein [Sphingomicrobium sp.]
VKLRKEDMRPVPVALPFEVVAVNADEAMAKLQRLANTGKWPGLADAVRLFEDGTEIDSFIPGWDESRAATVAEAS